MTIEKERSGNIPAYIAEKAHSGSRETWAVHFADTIENVPDADILKALEAVSWLWSPAIIRTGHKTVTYTGYTD